MIWAAVGALAAVLGPLMLLFFNWLRSDIRELKADLNARLDRVDARLDRFDDRFDRVIETGRQRGRARI